MPTSLLRAWPLEGVPPLPLPPLDSRLPWHGVGTVTGGGLVARITTGAGLQEVRREGSTGVARLTLPPALDMGAPGAPGATPFLVPGGWSRPLAEGFEERGALLDAFPVIVLQRLAPGSPHTVLSTHLVAPEDVSAETCRRLSAAIPARVLRRHARGSEGAGLTPGGSPGLDRVATALQVLDDAPLSDPADAVADATAPPASGPRVPALVGGVTGDRLHLLDPAHRVEIGLGALAGGRWPLAACIVDAVLEGEDGASPAARLLLATRWATWTGEVERLRPHRDSLDEAARSVVEERPSGDPGLPAAFPSVAALLADFADAVEPLGDTAWVDTLRQLARQTEPRRPVRGVRLPVIGGSSEPAVRDPDAAPGPRPASSQLPPVDAFASPHHASVAPRRTVHAARMVRSAVEGLCGVRPDAAWGRVTLAPDLRGLPADDSGVRHLVARGIRVGDVRIDLDCRVSRMGGTLRVSQVAGRVPMNVVFEPCLPLATVEGVRLAGRGELEEDADVEIEVLEDGVRLRFQFPLDPERRVSVDGAP